MSEMAKVFFEPINDVIQNPYIGIVSFNHFRGDKLYADTGTLYGWKKERYPAKPEDEMTGDIMPWHPESEVAYIRFLWKDFEPESGVYNTDFVADILKKARAARQHVILRMAPHNTPTDEDVPDWLRELIPCPERPTEKRVKDSPSDPLFLRRFAEAVRVLGAAFDADPVLYAVDISLTGAWGEGHGWNSYDIKELEALIDAYTESFPNTHLLGQICSPALAHYARKSRPMGWRADGFGDPFHMREYFPTNIYAMRDFWLDAPISCEAFWYMGEWKAQGWDIESLADQAIRWHISSFNNKSSSIPPEWRGAVERMLCSMGYRFALRSFFLTASARPGEVLTGKLHVDNRGNAPIYNRLPVRLRIKSGSYEFITTIDTDITRWLPGDTVQEFSVALPADIPAGEYTVQLCIGEKYPETPVVRLACNAPADGDFYTMTQLTIV